MDDVWKAPEAGAEVAAAPTGDGPGEPMDVLNALIADIQENMVGYLLNGLAYFGTVIALLFVAIAAIAIGVVPGIVMENEAVLMIGGLGGFTVYIVAILGFSFILVPLMMAATIRAAARQLDGEESIGLTSAFSGLFRNAGSIIVFYIIQQVLIMVGAMLLYLPGIIAMAVCHFAFVILVLEEVGIGEAFTKAIDHMREHAGFHVIVWLAMLMMMIVAQMTIVGIVFVWPVMCVYGVLVHRQVFGHATA